jgi:hypothetical protein
MKCRKTVTVSGQRGVALVLTLIMLAVITVVTVIFLATARRNRSSTTVRIDQTTAEFAAETAYQHATGKLIERILNDRNLLSVEFSVSRPLGYSYESNTLGEIIRPREDDIIPRVINPTNRFAHNIDVFLDLNRNGLFDDPGDTNRPFGDPIWTGILDRPWFPHSRTNRFVARTAYIIQPVGKSLDLNTIHHDTARPAFNPTFGYMRNQGFGPWELNLAAFLHEFNPTLWDYSYTSMSGRPATAGRAFEDALSIVRYREGWPLNAGAVPVSQTFWDVYPSAALNNFPSPSIDVYSDGDLLGYPVGADISRPDDDNATPFKVSRWPGADTTNHFFHVQELFDYASGGQSNKVTYDFYETLTNTLAGQPNGSAYYRMMAQLGTQTGSDFENRIHLNFADRHANLPGTNYSVTNFVAWDSSDELRLAFFTNVAQRIFLSQSNEFSTPTNLTIRSILEIPLAPTNLYSTAIHRILQQAANILDATRDSTFPTVFLPLFRSNNFGVHIHDFIANTNVADIREWMRTNVYGIPPVVGAKKHLPNFNEFSLVTDFLMTRKLQVERDTPVSDPDSRLIRTNQMYGFGISNVFAVEGWNSYKQPYRGNLTLEVTNEITLTLSNLNATINPRFVFTTNQGARFSTNFWGANSFVIPLTNNNILLANSIYQAITETFRPPTNTLSLTDIFEPSLRVPYFIATLTNRITYLLYDGNGRVLDCVVLRDGMVVDLYREATALLTDSGTGLSAQTLPVRNIWATNLVNGVPAGVRNQIEVSYVATASTASDWRDFNVLNQDKTKAIEKFYYFLFPNFGTRPASFPTNPVTEMQTGFNPATRFTVVSSWQANDPLVHYHPADLFVGTNSQLIRPTISGASSDVRPATLGRLNTRYSPWGGNPNQNQAANDPTIYDRASRDAGVYSPDEWQFPSNKLASVGLLGRVHRGTPWQTIYFKPERVPLGDWRWLSTDLVTAEARDRTNGVHRYLVSRTHPTNDWRLADMFTTGLDERTTQGLLSINQTNMESWSAAMSGVLVLSNNVNPPVIADRNLPHFNTYDEVFIQPSGGNQNEFFQIWTNIYRYQLARGEPLSSLGELIQNVPQLTVESPFLNTIPPEQRQWAIDDFAYEQIPQQILPLLRVGQSRFVVYAYGQALKPERINPSTGLVENYQVTAEFATRSVIRVEGNPRDRVRVVVESFNILPPD